MRQQVWDISQLDDFYRVIEKMAQQISRGVVYLQGDLGTGKTSLVKYWLQHLGVKGPVNSPSYQIVKYYEAGERQYLHADLYRLAEAEELLYLDVRDWQSQADLIFVEWPEKGAGMLPAADAVCRLALANGARSLVWEAGHNLKA